MDYRILLSLHLIFVVSWFAALLYIVRLFIYHVEAENRSPEAKAILQEQYKVMQTRLWYIIGWPAMILATTFGIWILVERPLLLEQPYMHVKLTLVGFLIIYHLMCERILRQLHAGRVHWKSFRLRLWNELGTMFLVAIIFTVIMKNSIDWINAVMGFLLLGVVLSIAARLYKKSREKRGK